MTRRLSRLRNVPGAVVVLIALAAGAWIARLEFQYCDYDDIADVGWMLSIEPAPPDTPAGGLTARSYCFRPVHWFLLWGLRELSGARAVPWVFHGFYVAAHALAAWLLHKVVAARTTALAGAVAGGLFALLPGGLQAVSWIAAGADQLAVTFILLAAVAGDRAMRTGSPFALAGTAAAVACALSSKETAIALLPALGITWLLPPAGASPSLRRRLVVGLGALAGVVAAITLRAAAYGPLLPRYPGGERLALHHLELIPTVLVGFLAPWDRAEAFRDLAPLSGALLARTSDPASAARSLGWIAAAAATLPVAVGAARTGVRGLAVLALLMAALVAVVVPILPLVANGGHLSRAWYAAAPIVAAMMALPFARGRPGPAFAAIAPVVLLALDAHAHVARTQLLVASLIRDARADMEALGAASPVSRDRFLIIEPPLHIGTVPFLGPDLANAVCPPFGEAVRRPVVWPNAASLKRCPAITRETEPILVVAWDGRRAASRGEPLPAAPAELPRLVSSGDGGRAYRPVQPVPPRAVAGISLRPARAGARGAARVTWTAGRETRTVAFDASAAAPIVVGVPDAAFDEAWFTAPGIDVVAVEGVDLEQPPELLRGLPSIRVARPAPHQLLPLASRPAVTFSAIAGASHYRLSLEFILMPRQVRIPLEWSTAASDLRADATGEVTMSADGAITIWLDGAVRRLDWDAVARRIAPARDDPAWFLPVEVRVEAFDRTKQNPIARSEPLVTALVLDPARSDLSAVLGW
jgi:hypothetical protein